MLEISTGMASALDSGNKAQQGTRFAAWWQQHSGLLGMASAEQCAGWLADHDEELQLVGIDRDERAFLYVAMRVMHPDPPELEFAAGLDIIFTPEPADTRLVRLLTLIRQAR